MTARLLRDLPTQPIQGAAAMAELGATIAQQLRQGDVVLFTGDLGCGKTTLIQGICAALGVDVALVSSPTFALVHTYQAAHFNICHADLYRLESFEELQSVGLDELLGQPDELTLVEWPQIGARLWGKSAIGLYLQVDGEGRTVVQLDVVGDISR